MREQILAALLAVAGVLVTVGAALLLPAAGWIVAGLVAAAWSWLVFGEVE